MGNTKYAIELFRELAPLNIRWFSQGTLSMARDPELLRLMADSGCVGVLVGFESLKRETLLEMNKPVNIPFVENVRESVDKLHQHGIGIYGTFIFGYSETAWHGHPVPLTCPPDRERRSLALYYYTPMTPAEDAALAFHTTIYADRPASPR